MIRISATVPDDVIAAANAYAASVDRSRSWVISESLRRYLAEPDRPEEALPQLAPGLGDSRLGQLRADLQLTPRQRVEEAERTAREARLGRPTAGELLIMFDSFEDYLEWDRWDALR
jgi:predicted transcriptional regulator